MSSGEARRDNLIYALFGACRAARWQSASALASRSRHLCAASALPSPRPRRSSLLLASGSSSSLDDSSFLSSPLSPFSPEATRAWASAAFLASSSALSLACGRREREATGAPSVPVAPHAIDALARPLRRSEGSPRTPHSHLALPPLELLDARLARGDARLSFREVGGHHITSRSLRPRFRTNTGHEAWQGGEQARFSRRRPRGIEQLRGQGPRPDAARCRALGRRSQHELSLLVEALASTGLGSST